MCGRYAAGASTDDLVEELSIEVDATAEPVRTLREHQEPAAGGPDYNVAPTKVARVVMQRAPRGRPQAPAQRQLRLAVWGLVPSWARDVRLGARMANARAETLLGKPAFRRAARSRRLLVPADGWFEWQASPVATDARGRPRTQPFFLHRADGAPLTFGGLYEFWRDPDGDPADPLSWLTTFTIITTAAEPGLDRVHDRQPLVIDPAAWGAWLDPACEDPDVIAELIRPGEPGRFAAHPVRRAVGSVRSNGPALLDPAPAAELDGVLDPATGQILSG